jgi:phage tail sheath gpL-like
MSTGSAVGTERVSRVVGYAIEKGSFQESSPNLPQKIIVFGEANTSNQSGLAVAKFDFTSAKEVGDEFGYGSPLHQIARILRPINSQGVGGIPTTIIPQITDVAATATTIKFAVTATAATKSTTHYIVVSGRDNVDGQFYAINVVKGDDAAAIEAKMIASVNAVLGSPVIASVDSGDVLFTSKWKGISSVDLNISIDTNGDDAGVVYAQSTKVDGTGVVSLTTSLALLGNEWNTIVVNPYGDSTTLAALESFK